MHTDHHIHFLPKIDDGSDSVETSLKMLGKLQDYGIKRFVATPHYFPHYESISNFLDRRQRAFESIAEFIPDDIQLILGAELAFEHDISYSKELDKLTIGHTNYLMIELPNTYPEPWMIEEISNIAYCGFVPVLAHIERYFEYFSKIEREWILSIDKVIFQFSMFSFLNYKYRKIFKKLYQDGFPIILGSDAHYIDDRILNYEKGMKILQKIVGPADAEKILSGIL